MTFNRLVEKVLEQKSPMGWPIWQEEVREVLRCLRKVYSTDLEASVSLIDFLDKRPARGKNAIWAWNSSTVKKNAKKRKGMK